MNERQSWNVIAVFLLLVFGLTAATLVHRQRDFSERENRSLATRPAPTLETLLDGSFESDYEKYLTDQFVGRDRWIGLKTGAERLSGKQEAHDVYFGRQDYLIEKHTGTFAASQSQANIRLLGAFFEQLRGSYGTENLTAMVIPNAVDILRDYLPALACPYDEEVYLEKVSSALPEGVWLDTSSVLREHADEELYYRTDHHWKSLGAFYIWQAFAAQKGLGQVSASDYQVEEVTDSFEGTVAAKVGVKVKDDTIERYLSVTPVDYLLTYNRSDDIRSTVYQESALDKRDKYAYFFGGNYGLIQAKTNADTGKRLLVIKDSYANCFVPFLLGSYDQVDMVDLRYYNDSLKELMDQEGYTDILFLYNASGFAEDTSLAKLLT